MKSTTTENFNSDLTPVDGQASLGLFMEADANMMKMPLSVVIAQPDKISALLLCAQVGGKSDSDICNQFKIDNGQWARIKNGKAHFNPNLETAFMQFCGNYIPLQWEMYANGFDPLQLKPLQSELEKELEKSQSELSETKREMEIMKKIIKEIR